MVHAGVNLTVVGLCVRVPVSECVCVRSYLFSSIILSVQESSDSSNTTIEDEDVKGSFHQSLSSN